MYGRKVGKGRWWSGGGCYRHAAGRLGKKGDGTCLPCVKTQTQILSINIYTKILRDDMMTSKNVNGMCVCGRQVQVQVCGEGGGLGLIQV